MLELLLLPFLQKALLVGLVAGLLLAAMGVFVVLRHMSFFSDAIGHSALTGIAAGLLIGFDPFWGGLIFAVLIAAGIVFAKHYSQLHVDTLLGIAFPSSVALAVILLRFTQGYQTDLLAFLFGDILTVTSGDILISSGLAVIVASFLLLTGKRLLMITVSQELAHAQGISIPRYELIFLMLLAAVITLSIKLVGVILVTAMLVIPAATAQNIASSLVSMITLSCAVSAVATVLGLLASAWLNLPSGPSIIMMAALLFTASLVTKRLGLRL